MSKLVFLSLFRLFVHKSSFNLYNYCHEGGNEKLHQRLMGQKKLRSNISIIICPFLPYFYVMGETLDLHLPNRGTDVKASSNMTASSSLPL